MNLLKIYLSFSAYAVAAFYSRNHLAYEHYSLSLILKGKLHLQAPIHTTISSAPLSI